MRESTKAGVELLGVLWLEELGELVLPEGVRLGPPAGEAVPEFEDLSFFEVLLESLLLESCSCYVSQLVLRQLLNYEA